MVRPTRPARMKGWEEKMKAGIAQSGRTIMAAITAALMVLSVMFVFASSADATHDTDPTIEQFTAESNSETYWEGLGYGECEKTDDSGEGPYVLGDPPPGQEWTLLLFKQGQENIYWENPTPGHAYYDAEWSHLIRCWDRASTTTTTAPTTTTTAPSTTTTTAPTTTTTAPTTTTTAPTTTTTAPSTTTTTTAPPEVGEIVVQKVVTGDASQTFEFTFNTTGFALGDNTLAHGESSSSGDIAAGDGYSVSEDLPDGWTQVSAVCDDGSPITNIDVAAGETVTCTFTNTIVGEVQASIVVTVDGVCEVDGDEGQGIIDVEISVDGGADVVISDSDGDVIETLTSSGTVTVPEGATYTWEATPNEGFEFPEGSETSGSITIETCSDDVEADDDDPETLPFTGLDTGMMSLFASALLGGGLLLVTAMRRQEEA